MKLSDIVSLNEAISSSDKLWVWGSLPELMKKADGIKFRQTREDSLSRNAFPTIGTVSMPAMGGAYYGISIHEVHSDGHVVLSLHIDVETSNENHRADDPKRKEKFTDFADKIAKELGGVSGDAEVVPFKSGHGPQNQAPKIIWRLTMDKRKAPPTSHSGKYDPHAEYLARRTPAAQARASRISASQFASSHGGDASNYRN